MFSKFIQNNCLVLSYRLRCNILSYHNEFHIAKYVAEHIKTFGKVLYVKPTLRTGRNNYLRQPTTIDFVIGSSNIKALSNILYNLRAIELPVHIVNNEHNKITNSQPTDTSMKDLSNDNREHVEGINNYLIDKWAEKTSAEMLTYQSMDTLVYFNSIPTNITSEKLSINSNNITFNKYRIREALNQHRLENPMDDRLQSNTYSNYNSPNSILELFPYIYKDSSSLPGHLKKWFSNGKPEITDKERHALDILLHGFDIK